MSLTTKFSYITVGSEIEALLLEARLVNNLKTFFNIQLKDDKNPLYIRITNDEYPLVLTARKVNLKKEDLFHFGPFPSSASVKKTLSLIRKVFPYSQHPPVKRECLYSQIGLCNPCPSNIEKSKNKNVQKMLYLKNIKMIAYFLKGNISEIKLSLERKMKNHIKALEFEKASEIHSKISAIEYICNPKSNVSRFLENPNFLEDQRNDELNDLIRLIEPYITFFKITRIEAFDVSHLSGTFPTASMVTFINGNPDKSQYRHFIIRQAKPKDDISSLKEVALRRIKHLSDWGIPDLILVDGGKNQVNIFTNVFKNKNIPIIGIAKKTKTLIIPSLQQNEKSYVQIKLKPGPSFNLIERLKNEAHRFARRLHHKQIENKFLKSVN